MSNAPVVSITDEQLEELERAANRSYGETTLISKQEIASFRFRLRAAEKDVARLDWLDRQVEAYGMEVHEGNRWVVDGPFNNIRKGIDAAMELDQ